MRISMNEIMIRVAKVEGDSVLKSQLTVDGAALLKRED